MFSSNQEVLPNYSTSESYWVSRENFPSTSAFEPSYSFDRVPRHSSPRPPFYPLIEDYPPSYTHASSISSLHTSSADQFSIHPSLLGPTSPFLHETPFFESSVAPPDYLVPLLRLPDYELVWSRLDAPSRRYLYNNAMQQHSSPSPPPQQHVSRRQNLLLATVNSGLAGWVELARWEQDHGAFFNAHTLYDVALSLYPHNEILLQKKLKVEERVAHGDHVHEVLLELIELNTSKSVKVLVEGITSLAKLGYERDAVKLFHMIQKSPRFYTGNLIMEILLCEDRIGSRDRLLSMIPRVLSEFPKHGPIWFFVFDFYEHDTLASWDTSEPRLLFPHRCLDGLLKLAETCLPTDILWKILSNRNQYCFRCCVYTQRAVSVHGSSLAIMLKSYHILSRYLAEDMRKAISKCPNTLVWKLYLQFGRFTAAVGWRTLARNVIFLGRSHV